ncbi:NAD(P)H-dependent glycerol-3-phosphate dehydrogenase [Alterinioella nitratireducens]|uniref:NAD(P)H-dependent glycerol-3-phosphate dehydrogenase n=1 Tax=Alterinioella nitratireducens TaxID=2735915 RepID=UPI001556243F|nr:NAD(P)H-dependent glycerol-3-phosphate dehydrogenase [Alterinioella nitratireducens]NPD20152.1 NAD(P)-dependent glycerol-3-phosphate dehydrogenase [Alterinioella nitratireducens]
MIDIAGAGAFGTALAIALARGGAEVTLWARAGAEGMQDARENAKRLAGHRFPDALRVTGDLSDLTSDILLVAIPTQKLDGFLDGLPARSGTVLSCAKGIHKATGLSPSALIAAHAEGVTTGALTGPSFAADIAAGLPTALTLACADDALGAQLQDRLSTPVLRLYRTTDVVGAELGGALKNVIAIAAGAVMGAGLGESARAALMARGFAEMRRVARDRGARDETLAGLSGFGDLVLTCTSEKSRNYRFGQALGAGKTPDAAMTVEGTATAQEISAHPDLDTPIATAVAALSGGQASVQDVMAELLNRPLKQE